MRQHRPNKYGWAIGEVSTQKYKRLEATDTATRVNAVTVSEKYTNKTLRKKKRPSTTYMVVERCAKIR